MKKSKRKPSTATLAPSKKPEWEDDISDIRIMANAEGYVMFRRPGRMVMVASEKEFSAKFKRKAP